VLPPGDYGIAATREGTPYEGNGTTPLVHEFSVTAGQSTVLVIPLPATGHVQVTVVDEQNAPVPARVAAVGFDPSPDISLGDTRLFHDPNEALPYGMPTSAIPSAAPRSSTRAGHLPARRLMRRQYSYFSQRTR
jgi:hypothetical protein